MEKHLQKLLIIGPKLFLMYWPAAKTSPEFIFLVINMSQDASVFFYFADIEKGKEAEIEINNLSVVPLPPPPIFGPSVTSAYICIYQSMHSRGVSV